MQYLTYDKMLRLRNGGDNILSKTITFCTNDQERIFECVSGGVLAVGGFTHKYLMMNVNLYLQSLLTFHLFNVMFSCSRDVSVLFNLLVYRSGAVGYTWKHCDIFILSAHGSNC